MKSTRHGWAKILDDPAHRIESAACSGLRAAAFATSPRSGGGTTSLERGREHRMPTADELLAKAAKCRFLARGSADAAVRAKLLHLAEELEAEAARGEPESAPGVPNPIAR